MRSCIEVFCKKLGVLHESKEFVCEIMEVAYKRIYFYMEVGHLSEIVSGFVR